MQEPCYPESIERIVVVKLSGKPFPELLRASDRSWLHSRARTYTPKMGRWLSVDPLARLFGFATESRSPVYVYSDNDPVNSYDPTGLLCQPQQTCKIQRWIPRFSPSRFDPDESCGHVGQNFTATIIFSDQPPNSCHCCEFRQFVKGRGARARYSDPLNPNAVTKWTYFIPGMPPQSFPPFNSDLFFQPSPYYEDYEPVWNPLLHIFPGSAAQLPYTFTPHYYGHRSDPDNSFGDRYSPPRARGCVYSMSDTPGLASIWKLRAARRNLTLQVEVKLKFVQMVIDTCSFQRNVWPNLIYSHKIVQQSAFEIKFSFDFLPLGNRKVPKSCPIPGQN